MKLSSIELSCWIFGILFIILQIRWRVFINSFVIIIIMELIWIFGNFYFLFFQSLTAKISLNQISNFVFSLTMILLTFLTVFLVHWFRLVWSFNLSNSLVFKLRLIVVIIFLSIVFVVFYEQVARDAVLLL